MKRIFKIGKLYPEIDGYGAYLQPTAYENGKYWVQEWGYDYETYEDCCWIPDDAELKKIGKPALMTQLDMERICLKEV